MNEENDVEYVILLHIVEAVGLHIGDENAGVIVSASLGGNKLETEVVTSGSPTVFNNNLIWETDKKSIKRMKTENLPIKIEVHSVTVTRGQQVQDLIGYILLPIRGIPISVKKTFNIKPHWYKLIGLNANWKIHKPELAIFVTITEKQNLVQRGILDCLPVNLPEEKEELVRIEPCSTDQMLISQQNIFIKLLQDEGLLQVGNLENDCDIFIVKLMFKNAKNLEQIINPEEQMHSMFRIHYNLLGTPTHCALIPKGNNIYSIQEKIAIHFRTSLFSLNEYFNKVLYIPIDVYYNDSIVGHACFDFKKFITTTNLSEFLSLYGANDHTFEAEGTFLIETLFDLPPTSSKPYVEYEFNLKYLSTTKVGNCEVILDKKQVAEYKDNQAGGDISDKCIVELPPTKTEAVLIVESESLKSAQSDSILATAARDAHENRQSARMPKVARSDPVILKSPERLNIGSLLMDKNMEIAAINVPKTFSFNLMLQTVKFTRRPDIGIWQISLHHPKADIPFTITNIELSEISSNVIEFKNLDLQLLFASTTNEILDLIESESCVLSISGPRGVHATAELDNKLLLVTSKEERSGVILMENESREKVAMAFVFVYLDDLGFNLNSQVKKHSKDSTISYKRLINDNLAYKIVEELEEWKQQQQENFLVELKRKEINHLAMLSAEWQKKKLEKETKLAEKLEQCAQLAASLEEASLQLQEKGIRQLEEERIIAQTKNQIEQNFSAKLLEMNEKTRRLEDDMMHQMKLQDLKCRELQMSKATIERENEKIRAENKELNEKIGEMRKTYLPREQLAGLFQDVRILSERLEEVQKSKIFYKDQWARIIREVHKMKSENLHQMELQLKQCRSVGLDNLLHNEHHDLFVEKDELNRIKDILKMEKEPKDDYEIDEEFNQNQTSYDLLS